MDTSTRENKHDYEWQDYIYYLNIIHHQITIHWTTSDIFYV